MKKKIVLFAGTSEGRRLAEAAADTGMQVVICVATDYGERILPEHPNIQVHNGRMDEEEIRDFLADEKPALVVDATHPHARLVSEYVRGACESLSVEYLRLLRENSMELEPSEQLHLVEHAGEAAELAERLDGNIFLATGSKELAQFCQSIHDRGRLYARVLPTAESMGQCAKWLEGRQLICMQGPFSAELNRAMYLHTDAKILVTKESGDAGGYAQKIRPALELGMHCIVIQRPAESGFTYDEVCDRLGIAREEKEPQEKQLFLIGIGTGSRHQMTLEAREALEQAQVIFGAKRLLAALSDYPKKKVCEYRGEVVADYLRRHDSVECAAVVFSGDVGFYSGADGFGDAFRELAQWRIKRLPGISSLSYFAAAFGIPWQDFLLCSLHGRSRDLAGEIRRNPKVFTLLNSDCQLHTLAQNLNGEITVKAGYDLGYETQELWQGSLADFCNREVRAGLAVALFENPNVDAYTTGTLRDEAFARGNVPLTKEEIRALALSKLRLRADSVCYDVGAGTGGMSIDMARFLPQGRVLAFEQKPKGCELIRQNAGKFGLSNIQVFCGQAPGILAGHELPSHAFIGGSGGHLREILELLLEQNPDIRIVLDAITLETVGELTGLLSSLPVTDVEIISVTVAKAKAAGAYHLMEGMNPVYICSFTGRGGE
jgi:precorrin-6Y C5,15-methyltransferase (decarboxylating)